MATLPIVAPKQTPQRSSKKSSKPSRPSRPKAGAATLTYAQYEKLTVVNQIRRAFMRGQRLSAVLGVVLGGSIPVATYVMIHDPRGVAAYPMLWLLISGCLLYSAPKVFQWLTAATGSKAAAICFTLAAEGILTFVHIDSLTYLFLGILVFINAVSMACGLQVRKEEKKEESSASLSIR